MSTSVNPDSSSAPATLPTGEQAGSTAYVVLLTLVAALGGLLFGYDTAVNAGAITFLKTRFGLGDLMEGLTTSSVLVGCMIGASFAGMLSDRFGRKKSLLLAAVLFTVSAIGAALPRSLTTLLLARMLGGIGVGVASMVSPLYIAEISPARIRGRLVSVNQLAIVSGIFVVYFVNAWIATLGDHTWNVNVGWRWMFASGSLPAIVFLALSFVVPESPRWLVKQGRPAEARSILARVGGKAHAHRELLEIEEAIAHEGGSVFDLLQPGLRFPLIIGIILAVLQQITGINTVFYYATKIFENAGMSTNASLYSTVLVGLVNLVFTLVAVWVVDRVGRKPLLLIASIGMGASLCLMSLSLILNLQSLLVILFVLAYVASFAVAMGPIVWVVIAEIFPTRIRGRAMSIATVCLWIACFLVSLTFPWMLNHMAGYAFFVYALMCAVSFWFVRALVPETKGKTLEEIEKQWTGKRGAFPVQTMEEGKPRV